MRQEEISNLLSQMKETLYQLGVIMSTVRDSVDETGKQLKDLNQNLKNFNDNSGRLQKWLIGWTAVIAMAAIISFLI